MQYLQSIINKTSIAQRSIKSRSSQNLDKLFGGTHQVGDNVVSVLWLLQSTKSHLGTWNVLLWVFQVIVHGLFIPFNALLLVGVGVGVTGSLSRVSTKDTMQIWSNLVRSTFFNGVTLQTSGFKEVSTFLFRTFFEFSWHFLLRFKLLEKKKFNRLEFFLWERLRAYISVFCSVFLLFALRLLVSACAVICNFSFARIIPAFIIGPSLFFLFFFLSSRDLPVFSFNGLHLSPNKLHPFWQEHIFSSYIYSSILIISIFPSII